MVWDTWHNWSGSQCATCQMFDESNMSSRGTYKKTHGIMPLDRNPKGRDKWIRESKLANGGLTCGMRRQVPLTKFSQLVLGEGKRERNQGEEEEEARESLNFL